MYTLKKMFRTKHGLFFLREVGAIGEVYAIQVDAYCLVHHGLVGPLRQQRRHRVVLAIQDQLHTHTHTHTHSEIRQAA